MHIDILDIDDDEDGVTPITSCLVPYEYILESIELARIE